MTDAQPILSEDLLHRFAERSGGYDRDNPKKSSCRRGAERAEPFQPYVAALHG